MSPRTIQQPHAKKNLPPERQQDTHTHTRESLHTKPVLAPVKRRDRVATSIQPQQQQQHRSHLAICAGFSRPTLSRRHGRPTFSQRSVARPNGEATPSTSDVPEIRDSGAAGENGDQMMRSDELTSLFERVNLS